MQGSTAGYSTVMGGTDITVDHQVQLFLPYRRNLCPTPNFTRGTRGWWTMYANTIAFAEAAPPVLFNGEALAGRITWATGAANADVMLMGFPTIPGKDYTVSVQVYQPASTPRLGVGAWGIAGIAAASTFGAWQRVWLTFTATDTMTTIDFFNADAAAANPVTWITDILFEQTDQQLPYFDGDMTGARWVNDAGNSASELNLLGFTDVSLTIESLTINRDTTTDMPNGTRLVTGYPAADAQIQMAGSLSATDASQTPAALFNPYNTSSVLYGTDYSGAWVQCAAGVYPGSSAVPELTTGFTGLLDDVEIDLATGSVTARAIDYRNVLKTAPALPTFWAVPVPNTFYNPSPLLTAHYGIDYLLRQAGIYSSPPPRPGCIFYQSLHGSMWPEINGGNVTASVVNLVAGVLVTDSTTRRQFDQGLWSPQTMTGSYLMGASLAEPVIVGDVNHGIYIEMTGYFDTTVANNYFEIDLGYNLQSGLPVTSEYRARVQSDGAGNLDVFGIYQPYNGTAGVAQTASITPTVATGYHTIAWSFTWLDANRLFVVLQVDWTIAATTTLTFTGGHTTTPWTTADRMIGVNLQEGWAAENVQITNELMGNAFSSTHFTPTAYLDASLNDQMTTLPDTAGGDPWQVLQQAMNAEQGVAGFDEKALFRFYNRNTLRSRLSTKNQDAAINLLSTQIGVQQASVYTHVQVPVTQYTLGPGGAVWQANTPMFVPANSSIQFNVNLSTPAVNIAETDSGFAPSGTVSTGQTYWRAGDRITGGVAILGGVTVRVVQLAQKVLQITIKNTNGLGVWLVTPVGYPTAAGTPCLVIGGQSLMDASNATDNNATTGSGLIVDVQWPPIEEGGAVSNPRGDILLPISSNPWQQDYDVATDFAWDLLADLYQNRPIITNAHSVCDPRIQLTDRNTLIVPEYSINDDVFISGIHTTIDRGTWDQELVLRAVAAPGEWVLGDAVRSILAATTVM